MELGLARALHVLGVILWIGGVAMVTLSVLPAIRALPAEALPLQLFDHVERRFARQSRWTTLLVGLTGFYMTAELGLWERFARPEYWWMHAMVLVWLVFTVMLFVLEPLFLHRWLHARAARDLPGTMRLIARLHGVLLVLSLATAAGAVAGSHGVLLWITPR